MADETIDTLVAEMLDAAGITRNRDVAREILTTAAGLGADDPDRLDLKITSAALQEMRAAFRVFAPYRDGPEGDDLRVGPHPARRPAVRAGPRRRRRAGRRRAGW